MKRILFVTAILSLATHIAIAQRTFIYVDQVNRQAISVGKSNLAIAATSAWIDLGDDTTTRVIKLPCVKDTGYVTGTKKAGEIAYCYKYRGIVRYDGNKWILPLNTASISAAGDSTSTIVTVPHGLAWTPTIYGIVPTSALAKTIVTVTTDSANVYVKYSAAPATNGTQSFNITFR